MNAADIAAIRDELTPTPLTEADQATARLAFDHALQTRLRLVQLRVHLLGDRSLVDVAEAAGWLISYIRDEQNQRAQQALAEATLTPDADGADKRSSSHEVAEALSDRHMTGVGA